MKTLEITNLTRAKTTLAAIRKGNRDLREGRTLSHEKPARWLRSWGKKRELPSPSCK